MIGNYLKYLIIKQFTPIIKENIDNITKRNTTQIIIIRKKSLDNKETKKKGEY